MSHGKSGHVNHTTRAPERRADADRIATTHNTARYFTENRHVAWIALFATVVWGILSYVAMPKRKDPEIPVRVAAAIVAWPGAGAEKIEQLVTRRVEEKLAESSKVEHIDSTTRTGITVITVTLQEGVKDPGKEFDDIKLRLDSLQNMPQGVQPLTFLKDFGDTTALMLTIASPRAGDVELQLRSQQIVKGIQAVRTKARPLADKAKRGSLVYSFPATIDPRPLRRVLEHLATYAEARKIATDIRFFEGTGFFGLDAETTQTEEVIKQGALLFLRNRMNTSELHPDVWRAIVVFDPAETETKLHAVAEARYSYRELDDFTDILKKRLQSVPEVAKVTRSGVLPEVVYLDYSQERLQGYGIGGSAELRNLLGSRNITAPGGVIEAPNKKLSVDPSGELRDEREIGDVLMTTSTQGSPVYLRDLFDVERGYESLRGTSTSTPGARSRPLPAATASGHARAP
jgi:multidrug efflux pump subunit AcrB